MTKWLFKMVLLPFTGAFIISFRIFKSLLNVDKKTGARF